ncbi:MAG: hypothetical protein EBT20_18045 [Alphaproteobacteria bacterium]|nr:hypothetical protein [Alphaproteobacteria bacterium]
MTLETIQSAWWELGVLAFPDQDLSPEQQAAFSAQFGALDVYPFMTPVQSHPNVIPIIKEPDAKLNFGGGWHTDTSYLEKPPKATVLYAVETPPEGGDTLFADARAAFDALRIAEMVLTPRGLIWGLKQVGMQRTNRYGKTWTPINLLANIATQHLGLKWDPCHSIAKNTPPLFANHPGLF